MKVVLGLRGSNGIIEAQLDEVLIRNGVPNPSQIILEENEKEEGVTHSEQKRDVIMQLKQKHM